MAQLLYEALTGSLARIDNQGVLTVQSLLDSPSAIATESIEEEDIFQCGKCKKQFTSIQLFLGHKKEGCSSISSTLLVRPLGNVTAGQAITLTSASLGQQQVGLQVPTSPLSALTSGVVLSESDLLSLTTSIDQAALTPTSNGGSLVQSLVPSSGKTITLHSDISSFHSLSPQSSIGLSLLAPSTSSGPLLISSQTNPLISLPGVMVNISPTFDKSEDKAKDVVSSLSIPTTVPISSSSTIGKEDCAPKSGFKTGNPVNIITEFHSSMVKHRKRGTANSSLQGEVSSSSNNSSRKQGRVLKCAYCSKTFGKNFDLQQHIRCHTGEKPFQCIVCGRAFAQKSNVKKHLKTHMVWPDGLANTLPQQVVPNANAGTKNLGVEQNGRETVLATNVQKSVDDVQVLDDSSSSVPVNNSYVCPYCNFNVKTYYKLKSHMKTHKQEKVYKCVLNSCGQMVEDLDAFLEHIKSHESEMMYGCHVCTKSFHSLYDLGIHQYSHSLYPIGGQKNDPRYYRCNRCLNKYSTLAALDHHMATSSHSYPCPYCDKTFVCERYLRRHLQTHGTTNLHTCEDCQKSFKTEHYLKIHKLIHTGEKPFLCSQCGATFNRQDKLKRHLLIHNPNKKFKCPFRNYSGCAKEFNRPDKLKAHIITHSSNKCFTCKVCSQTFSRRSHLKAHELTHDLPYRCSKCNAVFAKETAFNEHKCGEDGYKRREFRSRPSYSRYLISRAKKSKYAFARKRSRSRKLPVQEEICEAGSLDDDIPTAHIEIISANGDLDVATTDLTQFSVQLHPIVTTDEFVGGHTVVATAEIPYITAEVTEINVLQHIHMPKANEEKS